MGEFVDTRWIRIFLLGAMVWLIPFTLSLAFFWLEMLKPDHYYPYTMLAIGAVTTLVCAIIHLAHCPLDQRWEGLAAGLVWPVIVLAAQLASLFFLDRAGILAYLQTGAWQLLYIPVITIVVGFAAYGSGKSEAAGIPQQLQPGLHL